MKIGDGEQGEEGGGQVGLVGDWVRAQNMGVMGTNWKEIERGNHPKGKDLQKWKY